MGKTTGSGSKETASTGNEKERLARAGDSGLGDQFWLGSLAGLPLYQTGLLPQSSPYF